MRRVPGAALALLLGGCNLFGQPVPDGGGGGGGGGGSFGYGRPTLELTIGSQHFGPSAPDTGSGVDLQTSRDAAGQVTSASLSITASSAASGASCSLGFQRFGTSTGIAPFRGGGAVYHVASVIDSTPDGVVTPAASEAVAVPQLVLQCSGSDCNGGVLLLTTLTADHVEGSFSGNLNDTAGRGATSAVCSFYLPTRSFSP